MVFNPGTMSLVGAFPQCQLFFNCVSCAVLERLKTANSWLPPMAARWTKAVRDIRTIMPMDENMITWPKEGEWRAERNSPLGLANLFWGRPPSAGKSK